MSQLIIRYCGGCNPTYDRVGLVTELLSQGDFQKREGAPEPDDIWLGVSGCQRTCMKPTDDRFRSVLINSPEPISTLVERIRKEAETPWE